MAAMLVSALCYSGLCALCLSMARHYRQCWSRAPQPYTVNALRVIGWPALGAALCASVARWGAGLGSVFAVTALGAVGLLLVGLMSWRPRWAVLLAPAWLAVAAGLLLA